MKKDKKRKLKSIMGKVLFYFIFFIIGVLIGLDKIKIPVKSFDVPLILSLCFFIIGVFIHINIHEFGHFIFGKLFAYKLISYCIAFLCWTYENGKMKFSIRKNKGYGGLCAMIPPERNLPDYIYILFYSSGIIMNLVFSALFFLFSTFVFSQTTACFFHELFLTGIFLGIINMIPFTSGNYFTDGKVVLSILLKRPAAEKIIELQRLSSQLAAGVRPGNLEISLAVDEDNLEGIDLRIIILLYFKALDNKNGEVEGYLELIEKNINKIPSFTLPTFYYEICYNACIMNNKEKAEKYYKKGGKILQKDEDANGCRIKAYYEYYINDDKEKALAYCNKGLVVVDKFPIKGQAVMEEELIRDLKNRIEGSNN